MNTEIVEILEENIGEEEEKQLQHAGKILKDGGLVAFPTETVYGLGGDALNPTSSHKIYAAKGRPSDNPLIVHISCMEDLYKVAKNVSKEAKLLADAYWPGPLTMIFEKADCVPLETTGGLLTVAVRMPKSVTARKLIAYAGGFVAAPSANVSGRPSPTVAKYVVEDMQGKIEMIIDGGAVGIGLESTIVDMTVNPPQILRPGFITEEKLSKILGTVESDVTMFSADTGQAPKAPGMKYRHYAPKGLLTIVEGTEKQVVNYVNQIAKEDCARGEKVGVIAVEESAPLYKASVVKCVGSRNDEESIARHLYEILRQFDEENVTVIYSESFLTEGFGQAIMNRLLKAAGHHVVTLDETE